MKLENQVIAKYMGWADKPHSTISPDATTNFQNEYMRFDSPDGKISLSYYWDDFDDQIKYHESWDWLMPVIKKVLHEAQAYENKHKGDTETIRMRANLGGYTSHLIGGLLDCDIERCYTPTVKLINLLTP